MKNDIYGVKFVLVLPTKLTEGRFFFNNCRQRTYAARYPKGLEFKLTLINFTNKYKVTTNMQASVIGVGMFSLEYKKK